MQRRQKPTAEPLVTVSKNVTTDKSMVNVAEVRVSANVGANTLDKLRT